MPERVTCCCAGPQVARTSPATQTGAVAESEDAHAVRAAEDLVDAATGLDGRALATLRDLVVRPWTMIQRAAFENDRRYVGAVKLSLAMSTVAIVLMSWLVPSELYFDRMRASDPEGWAVLVSQLDAHGVCFDHFADRFSNRHELLNTASTLIECIVFAAVVGRFDRRRPWFAHLNFVLYCYSLWLLITIPLQFLTVADIDGLGVVLGLAMVAVLPGLMILGLVRLYPAPWPRQLARGTLLLVLTVVLFIVSAVAIAAGAMAWTRASFGI